MYSCTTGWELLVQTKVILLPNGTELVLAAFTVSWVFSGLSKIIETK